MKQLIPIILLFMTQTLIHAQVMIGSEINSERAAILTLKSQEANSENETSKVGGLLLPRVALVHPNTLEPFVRTDEAQWTDAAKKTILIQEHTGLVVYNLTNDASFKPGTYIWDGNKWDRLFKSVKPQTLNRIVFPLPAFNLPLVDASNPERKRFTINLYNVYTENMHLNNFITNMSDKASFIGSNYYQANELDYVVSHYDKNIITIHSISNTGIMDYTVHNINPKSSSFVNIYLVVHEGKEKK